MILHCQRIICQKPQDLRLYSLSGLPPLTLPTVVVNQVANQTVYYNVGCEEGQTLTFAGTLPGWITIDTENSRLVGASGTFLSATQLAATQAAQEALDTFAQNAITEGELTCGAAASCDGSDTNQYALVGYSDGQVENPDGSPPVGGEIVWDGVFPYLADGDPCRWMANYFGSGTTLLMDGNTLCNAIITFFDDKWQMFLYDSVNADGAWRGEKLSGTSPVGVYTRVGGASATPATLTVAQSVGSITVQPEPNCVPS